MSAQRSRISTKEFAETCHKLPALLTYRVRCGKADCPCASGEKHGPYWFLRWRDHSGKNCRRYVRLADVESVRTIITNRRAARHSSRMEAMAARAWLRSNRQLLRDLEDRYG